MIDNRENVSTVLNALLLNEIESKGYYSGSLQRIATWSNPYIDYGYLNVDNNKTIAIIFYNSQVSNEAIKEHIVKSLNKFDSVLLCFESTELNNADILNDEIRSADLYTLPIGIAIYDKKGNVSVLHKINISTNTSVKRTEKEQKSYWCWWRDASHYEVAKLLELSEQYDDRLGDIYSKYVYPEFYDLMISGKTYKWDGTPRKKKYSSSSYKSEKQNYKIPLCQLGLWDPEEGRITRKGRRLLSIINRYGVESKEYFNSLAKAILIDGKHLDLIKDLEDYQSENHGLIPETSSEFFALFDEYMINKNSIGTRKPTAVTTGAKKTYVRDEPKLWNKLGLIRMVNENRYYQPFVGIVFNWDRINDVILFNSSGGINENV